MCQHKISQNNSFLLNIVRITAATFVLAGHSFFTFQKTIFKNHNFFPDLQSCGVVLFFILAGFFSAYSLSRKQDDVDYTFLSYIIEKLCRLWSGLIPALFFITLVDYLSISLDPIKYRYFSNYNFKNFVGNLFFLQSVFPPAKSDVLQNFPQFQIQPFGSGRHLWTLAIEWWIYIAVGFIFLVTIRSIKNNDFSFKTLCLTILFCLYPLELLYGKFGVIVDLVFIFILGFIIFYIYPFISNYQKVNTKYPSATNLFLLIFFLSLTVLLGRIYRNAFNFYFILSTALYFLCLLLLGDSSTWKLTKTTAKFISFFSSYTYSLYLYHYSILTFIVFYVDFLNRTEMFWATFILSHAVSILMYFLFERHGKALSIYFINLYRKSHS